MEGPIEEAEHEYEDEVIHDLESIEPTAARRLSSEAAKKKIVVETLKKMHSAQKFLSLRARYPSVSTSVRVSVPVGVHKIANDKQ